MCYFSLLSVVIEDSRSESLLTSNLIDFSTETGN